VIRSTNDIMSRQTLFDLNQITDRLGQVQRQLSSGKQIMQPEDDPFGAGRAVFLRNELGDLEQFKRTINESAAWLQASDSALSNAGDLLHRVRELVVNAGNGTMDASALNAIRSEVAQLKDAFREQANATFAGRHVFAGSATDAPPFPSGGNAYAGNTLPVQRLISPNQVVQVNRDGEAVFGPNGANVFDLMDTIMADLASANRTALGTTDLTAVDTALDRLMSARSDIGAVTKRLETQLSRLSDQEVNVSDLLSQTEDADMAKTMITFAQTQSVYQSALQAGARVIQPSLLDFLR
jgi:flagellar hook-associated protein 3 FlgL